MAPTIIRVVSLLPSATDTVNTLTTRYADSEVLPFELLGCSHECDLAGGGYLSSTRTTPVELTTSRLGDIPIEDIELAFNASIAAIQEFMTLCQPLAVPLLQYGLSAYDLDIEELCRIKPDVILTCLQTAHSCVLEGDLAAHAFESVLGYVPKVVHTDGQTLEEVYNDMLKISSAIGMAEPGQALVTDMRQEMERIGADVRRFLLPNAPEASISVVWWTSPLIPADAWVSDMLRLLGVRNLGADWKSADMVVWCLCGLGIDIVEREARKFMQRIGGDRERGARAQSKPVARQRMSVMDGVHYLTRPGPKLVESMQNLADMIFGTYGCRNGTWRWLEVD